MANAESTQFTWSSFQPSFKSFFNFRLMLCLYPPLAKTACERHQQLRNKFVCLFKVQHVLVLVAIAKCFCLKWQSLLVLVANSAHMLLRRGGI